MQDKSLVVVKRTFMMVYLPSTGFVLFLYNVMLEIFFLNFAKLRDLCFTVVIPRGFAVSFVMILCSQLPIYSK
jgi:hypothetical protein